MLTAGEFCDRDVVIALRHERVTEVARRMRDHHVGSVIVVDERADGRVPVGVLTDRDIVVGLVAVDPSYLDRAQVADLLSGKLVSAREHEDPVDVMARMRGHGVRRLPVVDANGLLQGLITFDDLVDYIAEELSRMAAILRRQHDKERALRPSLAPSSR